MPLAETDLKLIIQDALVALPEQLHGNEVISLLASVAVSYAENKKEALMHLNSASLMILMFEEE